MAIKLQDNFNDNSINTSIWTKTDTYSRITEQNNRLEFNCPHTNPTYQSFDTCKLTSIPTVTSGVATLSGNLDWTDPGTGETQGGFRLQVDGNNFASITSRDNGGKYRLVIVSGGSAVYDNRPGITKVKDVKITYDISSHNIKFWYWNGSTWTQMGTTQNYNLGSTLYAVIGWDDWSSYPNADLGKVDDVYFTDVDFATQYPPPDGFPINPTIFGGARGFTLG